MFRDLPVLDTHGHVSVPQASNAYVLGLMGTNYPMPSPLDGGDPRFAVSESDYRKAAAGHVRYLDERNIDVQVIGPRPFMMLGWMQPHLLPDWTRHVNLTIAQQVSWHPDRFVGACQLPQDPAAPDAAHMLAELGHWVTGHGFGAAYVSPDPDGKRTTPGMHEPYWFPLYERASELDIPLIVHGTNSADPRYRVVPHNYQLGFVTEQYLAAQFLAHGGVFDRYPDLRVIVCHCGGALDRFIPTDHHLAQQDRSANLFFDTCAYDLNFLEAAIKQRGVPRLCFGTEAPGSGRAVRPETGKTSDDLVPVIAAFSFLDDKDLRAIFHDNPLAVVPRFAHALASTSAQP
jgi:predicted TIM-barrel fold metal-dependent hydrolase